MKRNNKLIQKERDNKILKFLDEFQSATTQTIHELFFMKDDGTHTTLRMTQDTLQRLIDENKIKRYRKSVVDQYYYYLPRRKPSSQLKHTLLTTGFFRELSKLKDVRIHGHFKPVIDEFKPDSIVAFQIGNSDLIVIYTEIELSNKKFDIDKYVKCRRRKLYESIGVDKMPTLIVITNKKKIPEGYGVNIIKIKTDFSDIEKILKLKGEM